MRKCPYLLMCVVLGVFALSQPGCALPLANSNTKQESQDTDAASTAAAFDVLKADTDESLKRLEEAEALLDRLSEQHSNPIFQHAIANLRSEVIEPLKQAYRVYSARLDQGKQEFGVNGSLLSFNQASNDNLLQTIRQLEHECDRLIERIKQLHDELYPKHRKESFSGEQMV